MKLGLNGDSLWGAADEMQMSPSIS